MPPDLALLLWFVLLLALLYWDPAKEAGTSLALWVPTIWIFILASRLPSQWWNGSLSSAGTSVVDGNPIDRAIFSLLILLALGTLISRSFKWSEFIVRNFALIVFILFALLSVLWSDFPLVSLKRWFRDLGNYLMVLVVLSDPHPIEATRTLLRRVWYILIPLCILFDKYFPNQSRAFDPWTGIGTYAGATTGKNLLGLAALLSGLFFFWDTVTRWSNRKDRQTKRIILVNVAFFAMSIWVSNTANSATCRVCLGIGCLVITAAHSKIFQRHPGFLKALIPTGFILYLILAYGLGLNGNMAAAVGKDPTLTDRTKIWAFVLSMHTNPLLGTGYESFWLGPRLQWIWSNAGLGGLTEAHNGYIEMYLNLGLIGLFFLICVLIASYWNICQRVKAASSIASLNLAIWTIMLFYCVTEAGFRSGLMWVIFLLASIAIAQPVEGLVPSAAPIGNAGPGRRAFIPRSQSASQRQLAHNVRVNHESRF